MLLKVEKQVVFHILKTPFQTMNDFKCKYLNFVLQLLKTKSIYIHGHQSISFIAKCYEQRFRRGTYYEEEGLDSCK